MPIAKTIPKELAPTIITVCKIRAVPLIKYVLSMSLNELIIGTPGTKNNDAAIIGCHGVAVGKTCIKSATLNAENAAIIIDT